jgi:hypothetical protein
LNTVRFSDVDDKAREKIPEDLQKKAELKFMVVNDDGV